VHEADNLTTFMCRMLWKSGSLNLLEPSGPHRAYYGTPLPLPLMSELNTGIINSNYMLKYTHIKRCKLEQFCIWKCDVYLIFKNVASYKMLYGDSSYYYNLIWQICGMGQYVST